MATDAPAPAEAAAKAKVGKSAKAQKKGKRSGASKASKEAGAATPDGSAPNIAAHPRAKRAIARAKGWGGLLGFLIGGYLSLPTNTIAAAGLRALVAGVACYVGMWAGAVFVWRRLVMIEIKARNAVAAARAADRGAIES
jgi:hypothetical protein